MVTRDELLGRIKCKMVPAEDEEGNPIPELEGLYFRPLDVEDMLAVHEYTEKHGRGGAFRIMFVRSLRNQDGSRILTDEDADTLQKDFLSGPIGAAIPRIRKISGQHATEAEAKASQKKTSSTNGQT